MRRPPLADSGKPYLQIVDVVKQFGEHTAVNGVNLTIGKNEIFALLGSSGPRQITLLRMLAGMERSLPGQYPARWPGRDPAAAV